MLLFSNMSPPRHCVHCRCTRLMARQSAQPAAPTPLPETGPQVRGGAVGSGGVRVRVLIVKGTDHELRPGQSHAQPSSNVGISDHAINIWGECKCDMDETELFGCIIEIELCGYVRATRSTSRRKEELSDLPKFTFLWSFWQLKGNFTSGVCECLLYYEKTCYKL